MTYAEAAKLLTGRCSKSRKLANNTYLERINSDTIAVRLHDTDVVTFHSDGRTVLNTGGWRTVTTKERMNRFSPFAVWTRNGVWYVALDYSWDDPTRQVWEFENNISVQDGEVSIYPFTKIIPPIMERKL